MVTPHWPSYRRGLGDIPCIAIDQNGNCCPVPLDSNGNCPTAGLTGNAQLQAILSAQPLQLPSLPPVPTSDQLAQAAQLTADAKLRQFSGGLIDTKTLLYASGFTPADLASMANNFYQKAAGSAITGLQQSWAAATSPQANTAREAAGAEAGLALIQHGYDPGSNADNQQLIVAIAGACSLIPGVGPMIGGAIMILDAIGEGVAALMESVGLIWFGCRSSGSWTPATVLGMYPGIHTAPGTFAGFANAAIAQNAAAFGNCKGRMAHQVILASIAEFWNANSHGPPMSVYVPAMTTGGPNPFIFVEQAPFAFAKVSSISQVPNGNWAVNAPGQNLGPPFDLSTWTFESANAGDAQMIASGWGATPPAVLQLTGSIPNPPSAPGSGTANASAGQMSTVGKVAVGTAVVGGAALAGTAVYAFAKGQAVETVLKAGWLSLKGWFVK
jgi:hypothetical protein